MTLKTKTDRTKLDEVEAEWPLRTNAGMSENVPWHEGVCVTVSEHYHVITCR